MPHQTPLEIQDNRHIPVMLAQVLTWLDPKPTQIIVDGTFGAGGYSRAILEKGASIIGFDRDITAITNGFDMVQGANGQLTLVNERFSQMQSALNSLGHEKVDSIVLDIGVSSMQFDEGERGFSFRFDGPLDMRMGLTKKSAADLVNTLKEEELANLIYMYGEERASRPIAKAIVKARAEKPITTTFELVNVITQVLWIKANEIHPATRTFQALRIAVNEELYELEQALIAAEKLLKPQGRLVVVTFHSLEDRIVKNFLNARLGKAEGSRHMPQVSVQPASFKLLTKAIAADKAEASLNPRSRSAKLRAAERV
jgi:16S rRNA (cytosine1402-N4)-methyltransferase